MRDAFSFEVLKELLIRVFALGFGFVKVHAENLRIFFPHAGEFGFDLFTGAGWKETGKEGKVNAELPDALNEQLDFFVGPFWWTIGGPISVGMVIDDTIVTFLNSNKTIRCLTGVIVSHL